jgi:hypothetical protein
VKRPFRQPFRLWFGRRRPASSDEGARRGALFGLVAGAVFCASAGLLAGIRAGELKAAGQAQRGAEISSDRDSSLDASGSSKGLASPRQDQKSAPARLPAAIPAAARARQESLWEEKLEYERLARARLALISLYESRRREEDSRAQEELRRFVRRARVDDLGRRRAPVRPLRPNAPVIEYVRADD